MHYAELSNGEPRQRKDGYNKHKNVFFYNILL